MNKKLLNFTIVLAKIFEVFSWICDAALLIGLVVININKSKLAAVIEAAIGQENLEVSGMELSVIYANGKINMTAVTIAMIGGIVAVSLGAMICRNINQIFKCDKPFCDDNVRRVREIGIFAIAIPIVEIILTIILTAVSSGETETSVNISTIFFGLVVLALSQFFRYGSNLEEEVDGLV